MLEKQVNKNLFVNGIMTILSHPMILWIVIVLYLCLNNLNVIFIIITFYNFEDVVIDL